MKKILGALLLLAAFTGVTVSAVIVSIDKVSRFAEEKNMEKTALVQQRIDETFLLLNDLSEDSYIRSNENTFEEKAEFLTDKNQTEELGYMMLRILDDEINIYREDIGLASNLASREYMQELYSTGEQQLTDAFLAGADGKTINYTAAVGIKEDGKVVAALMAAIYGAEMDEYLLDENSENVLVGSQLQFMGGITEDQFGLSVAQVLESEQRTSRPVENILLDFYERKSGAFWGIGENVTYFSYAPIEHSNWVVMTEVNVFPLVKNVVIFYSCGVAVLLIIAIALFRSGKTKEKG